MAVGTNSNALYYSIRNGKVMRYSKTQEPGTTVVPRKDGTPSFFFVYDFIEGVIEGFRTKEEEIAGTKKLFLNLIMVDGAERYNVQIDVESNYFRAFAMTIVNTDPDRPVKLIPFQKEELGKKKTGLFVTQGDKPAKYKWTKENPGDLPPVEITKNKKGEVVDVDSEQRNAFLFNELNAWLQTGLGKAKSEVPATVDTFASDEDDSDDLPF